MRFATALADQVDPPARAADALDRERGRRCGRDPPARDRGGRYGEGIAALARMALEQQGDRLAAFGRQLQPAGIGHRGAPHLADHGAQAAVTQPFLHQREQFGIVACLGIEDALGSEPRLIEAGREQVPPAHHPQHRAPGASGDPGHEQGRGGIVTHARGGGSDLVKRPQSKAARRQPRIDRADPERQHRTPAQPVPLDRAQGFA